MGDTRREKYLDPSRMDQSLLHFCILHTTICHVFFLDFLDVHRKVYFAAHVACKFIQHASELLCVVPWISTCVVVICQNYCQMSRKLCWMSKCEGRGEWRSGICSFFDSQCTGCHGRLQNTEKGMSRRFAL